MYDIVIIGGGPSGIFAAINVKNKKAKIVVLEKTDTLFSKIKISGGGRCNITNAAFDPKELSLNYPRGGKELISAFHQFQPLDMIKWLNDKKVSVKIEKDKKVFPSSDSSKTIIDCFLKEIKNKNIEIRYNQNIINLQKKNEYFEIEVDNSEIIKSKNLILATGSNEQGLKYAQIFSHSIEPFIPSLFSFNIANSKITKLCGLSKDVEVSIKNSSFSYKGPILITHEGFSGPAIINLSSLAAKFLYENNYKATLLINWVNNLSKDNIMQIFLALQKLFPKKNLLNLNPFDFPKKLWNYFLQNFENIFFDAIQNVSKKNLSMLADKLYKDEYLIISKSKNKSEFVSCGGVNLKEINFKDMQSKICKNLYFTGELLNIDALTGGYNLQNAWTTGYIAGNSIN